VATTAHAARVLVVEDFGPCRTFIATLLENSAFQIIGEAANGVDGVERAQELKPDVVLMDIGLPGLNGFEAARLISKLVPSTRIVFLTTHTDRDLVDEALMLGGCGYVSKLDATSELLPGLEAAVRGESFVSSGI
jgi:DNA-binding NarL/FixJ family response regulator